MTGRKGTWMAELKLPSLLIAFPTVFPFPPSPLLLFLQTACNKIWIAVEAICGVTPRTGSLGVWLTGGGDMGVPIHFGVFTKTIAHSGLQVLVTRSGLVCLRCLS